MAVGDWHALDGGRYQFRETLHGPNVESSCVDCGARVYVVQPTGRIGAGGLPEDTGSTAHARCSTCGRRHHGAPALVSGGHARRPTGVGFPSALRPVGMDVDAPPPVVPAVQRGLVQWWPDDVPVPDAAAAFVDMLRRTVRGGAQVAVVRTVAIGPGGPIETCGVHFRGGSAFWTRHETPRVRHEQPRKVDLTRTATGRARIQRFDPRVWWTGGVTWTGVALLRGTGRPVKMTVTAAIKAIREANGHE